MNQVELLLEKLNIDICKHWKNNFNLKAETCENQCYMIIINGRKYCVGIRNKTQYSLLNTDWHFFYVGDNIKELERAIKRRF